MKSSKVPIVKTLLWFRLWKVVGWEICFSMFFISHPGEYEDSSQADGDENTEEHYQTAENDHYVIIIIHSFIHQNHHLVVSKL